VRPFKDCFPQVKPYSGETDRTPEAFLAQYYLNARQQNVPFTERTRQLIGRLTGRHFGTQLSELFHPPSHKLHAHQCRPRPNAALPREHGFAMPASMHAPSELPVFA
jgi:hypothetical protein